MELNFGPRGILQIDDAHIIYRNFNGEASQYNRKGDRNFAVVIPTREMADALVEDKNRYGVGWNVKMKPERDEGDEPFMYLPVKVRFNDYGPEVHLISGRKDMLLDEDSVGRLDRITIERVDLDIRPYDDVMKSSGDAFRSAYLSKIYVVQALDRFAERYGEEEYPQD